ncbi:MAG TPA: biosynthetic peptidoglycan transglycosylase, partial [Acidimicrobiales bacterium]
MGSRSTPPAAVLWLVAFADLFGRAARSAVHAACVAVAAMQWAWADRDRARSLAARFVSMGVTPVRETAQRVSDAAWRAVRSRDTRVAAAGFAGRVAGVAVLVAGALVVVGSLGRAAVVSLGEGVVGHVGDVQLPALEDRSVVVAYDGSPITVLDGGLNRKVLTFDQIAPVLVDAVVAVEDKGFWEHEGVDARAVVRAAGKNAQAGEVRQGGSTITQQLVKNALLSSSRDVERKVTEVVLAREVERRYSKREILERYLNTIYFGHGAYGVQAAAETYFGKPAADLRAAEAALLAGLIQSPNGYDPLADARAARTRRAAVLDRMVASRMLDDDEAEAAAGEPLPTSVRPMQTRTSFVTDAVTKELLADQRLGETV